MFPSFWKQRWAGISVPAHDEVKRILAEAKKKREKEKDEELAEWSSEENRCCRTCSGSSRNSKTSSSGSISGGVPEASEEASGATAAARKIFKSLVQEGADLCEHLSEIAALGVAEDWCIDESEVRLLPSKTVGAGTFGVVVTGVFCGMKVAVKLPRSRIEGPVVKRLPEVCNHLRTLRRLRHPNIAMVHGAVIDPQQARIGVVVEFVPGKRLDWFLQDDELAAAEQPDALVRCQIMVGVCCALMYMHSRTLAVTHGGIKHSAVMVEATGGGSVRPRLLDFGLSRAMSRHSRPSGDVLAWTAPEVLREGAPRRCHADIYAFGQLIAYTATGRMPMAGRSSREIRRSLLRGTYAMPSWPKGCLFQPSCQFLVERCLTVEEAQRPSAAQAHSELLLLPGKLGVEDSDSSLFAETGPPTVGWDEGAADICVSPRAQAGAASARRSTKQRWPALSPTFEPVRHKGETEVGLPTLPEAEPLHDGRRHQIHTNRDAKLISLCEAMSRWSCSRSQTACCPFHDRVKVAEEACHNLLNRPCKQGGLEDFDEATGKQCPSCGILGLEPSCTHCDICGKRLPAHALPCKSSRAAGAPALLCSPSESVRVSL